MGLERWMRILLLVHGACAIGSPHTANGPAPTLEQLVAQLVTLRTQIAAEKRAWKEKEQTWQSELQLLRTEAAALEKDVASCRAVVQAQEKERADVERRRERLSGVLAALGPILDGAERELRQWQTRLPPSLLTGTLRKTFSELPATPDAAQSVGASRRVQVVLALWTQIEELLHTISITRELVPLDGGGACEMDVMYVGSARAFAVSADDRRACIGTVGADGWQWVSCPDLAGEIRRAIRIAQRELPPSPVRLPLPAAQSWPPQPKPEK